MKGEAEYMTGSDPTRHWVTVCGKRHTMTLISGPSSMCPHRAACLHLTHVTSCYIPMSAKPLHLDILTNKVQTSSVMFRVDSHFVSNPNREE